MDFDDVKCLGKEELLRKLRQKGFDDVADILKDKDVDGSNITDPQFALEIIRWKLAPIQRTTLLIFIQKIQQGNSRMPARSQFHQSRARFEPPVISKKPDIPLTKKKANCGTLSKTKQDVASEKSESAPTRKPPVLPKRSEATLKNRSCENLDRILRSGSPQTKKHNEGDEQKTGEENRSDGAKIRAIKALPSPPKVLVKEPKIDERHGFHKGKVQDVPAKLAVRPKPTCAKQPPKDLPKKSEPRSFVRVLPVDPKSNHADSKVWLRESNSAVSTFFADSVSDNDTNVRDSVSTDGGYLTNDDISSPITAVITKSSKVNFKLKPALPPSVPEKPASKTTSFKSNKHPDGDFLRPPKTTPKISPVAERKPQTIPRETDVNKEKSPQVLTKERTARAIPKETPVQVPSVEQSKEKPLPELPKEIQPKKHPKEIETKEKMLPKEIETEENPQVSNKDDDDDDYDSDTEPVYEDPEHMPFSRASKPAVGNDLYENIQQVKENNKDPPKLGFLSRIFKGRHKSPDASQNQTNSFFQRPLPELPKEAAPSVEDCDRDDDDDDEYGTDYECCGNAEENDETVYPHAPQDTKQDAKMPTPIQESLADQLRKELQQINRKAQEKSELQPKTKPCHSRSRNASFHTPMSSENEFSDADADLPVYDNVNGKTPVPKNYEKYKPPGNRVSVETEDDEEIYFQPTKIDIKNNPYYRETTRKGARDYLRNLPDGAFMFRKSKKYFLGLTIKYDKGYYDLGIRKTAANKIQLDSDEDGASPEFSSLNNFVDHFVKESITFEANDKFIEVYLKPSKIPHLSDCKLANCFNL